MKNEMMSSGKGKRKITLDPRTKLALLLMVATFVLGGAGGNELIWARILLSTLECIVTCSTISVSIIRGSSLTFIRSDICRNSLSIN